MGRQRYDAFVSYSTDPDRPIAVALQQGLRDLYNPWYRPGKFMRVFRDETSMGSGAGLAAKIYRGLESSDHLVVLVSPEAADPDGYVNDEVGFWREHPEHRPVQDDTLSIIPVITWWGAPDADGVLPSLAEFDWEGPDLPPNLRGVFRNDDKPLAVDMRWAHSDALDLALSNPLFYKNVAAVAAGVRGVTPELFDKELRSQKLRARAWIGTIALAALILIGSISVALLGWQRAQDAREDEEARALAAIDEATAAQLETRQATEELESVSGQLGEAQTALADETARLAAAETNLAERQAELSTARSDLVSAQRDKAAADAAVVQANERVQTAQDEVVAANAEAADADARAADASLRLDAANVALDTAVAAQQQAEEAAAQAAARLDDLTDQVEAADAALSAATADLAAAQADLARTQANLADTLLIEEAADLAVRSAAAGTTGDAALGVLLAVEGILTIDPPTSASSQALVRARRALSVSSWQPVDVGVPSAVGRQAARATAPELASADAVESGCAHDPIDRRPLRLIRGTALTLDGGDLLVNTPTTIDAIDTDTRRRRTVLTSDREICGFDLLPDGSGIAMLLATPGGGTTLSAVDLATGGVRWSTSVAGVAVPGRIAVAADGRIAVEGRPVADIDLSDDFFGDAERKRVTTVIDPVTRTPIDPPFGFDAERIASFDEELLLFTGGDRFPIGVFDVSFVKVVLYDRDLEWVDFVDPFDDWARLTVTPDPAGGAVLLADDRGRASRFELAPVAPSSPRIVNGLSNPFVVDHVDGRAYAGTVDGGVTVLDLRTLRVVDEFDVADTEIESLALDTARSSLWVTAGDGTSQQVLVATDTAPIREVRAVSFESDSPSLPLSLTGAPNGDRLLIHNVRAFRPPSEFVTVCGEEQFLLDWTEVTELRTEESWLAMHPSFRVEGRPAANDRYLVAFRPGECWIQITDLTSRSQRYVEFDATSPVGAVAISELDDRVVVAGESGLWTFDAASGLALDWFAFAPGVRQIELAGDGAVMATFDGTSVDVWDVSSRAVVRSDVGADNEVVDLALTRDGSRLAIQYADRIVVDDAATGADPVALEVDPTAGTGLAFSRDGRFLAGAGGSSVWSTTDWQTLRLGLPRTTFDDVAMLGPGPTLAVLGVQSSPDGNDTVWIDDSLDPGVACAVADPLVAGRTDGLDAALRGDRVRRACR